MPSHWQPPPCKEAREPPHHRPSTDCGAKQECSEGTKAVAGWSCLAGSILQRLRLTTLFIVMHHCIVFSSLWSISCLSYFCHVLYFLLHCFLTSQSILVALFMTCLTLSLWHCFECCRLLGVSAERRLTVVHRWDGAASARQWDVLHCHNPSLDSPSLGCSRGALLMLKRNAAPEMMRGRGGNSGGAWGFSV